MWNHRMKKLLLQAALGLSILNGATQAFGTDLEDRAAHLASRVLDLENYLRYVKPKLDQLCKGLIKGDRDETFSQEHENAPLFYRIVQTMDYHYGFLPKSDITEFYNLLWTRHHLLEQFPQEIRGAMLYAASSPITSINIYQHPNNLYLSSDFPAHLVFFNDIQHLGFHGVEFNLPQPMRHCKNLKSLSLEKVKLSEMSPWILEHPKLESLSLIDTEILKWNHPSFWIPNLKILTLQNMGLTEVPDWINAEWIGHFKNLEYLDLGNQDDHVRESHNTIQEIPDLSRALPGLKKLSLGFLPIADLPETLDNLANLTTVYLTGTVIHDNLAQEENYEILVELSDPLRNKFKQSTLFVFNDNFMFAGKKIVHEPPIIEPVQESDAK